MGVSRLGIAAVGLVLLVFVGLLRQLRRGPAQGSHLGGARKPSVRDIKYMSLNVRRIPMRLDRLGVVALGFVLPALVGLNSCGSKSGGTFGPGGGTSSGNGGGDDAGDDGALGSSSGTWPGGAMTPRLSGFVV